MLFACPPAPASDPPANVWIQDTPAYDWHYGCYGGGSGMLFAFWDRNGYPDIYTGPTAGGVAPLTSAGTNVSIVALWASKAGLDGRPTNLYGHVDDYYVAYESTSPDPWLSRGVEHDPDCIGDFIGMSQDKWTNLNSECRGNRDAWAFNFFDTSGARRVNYQPLDGNNAPIRDVQSGYRAFAAWRGYDFDVFSQLVDIWMDTPPGTGFTFEDVRREIDAGRPILLHLQEQAYVASDGYNPDIHAFVIVGYEITSSGTQRVRVRTGWSANLNDFQTWTWTNQAFVPWGTSLYPRGVIGIRPKSVVTNVVVDGNTVSIEWLGPSGVVSNSSTGISWPSTWHVVEAAPAPDQRYVPVSTSSPGRRIDFWVPTHNADHMVWRLRRLEPTYVRDPELRNAVFASIPSKWGATNLLYDLDVETIPSITAPAVGITNLWGLQGALSLTNLALQNNAISDLAPLVACLAAGGLPSGSYVNVAGNPLSSEALTNHIPALISAGVVVDY